MSDIEPCIIDNATGEVDLPTQARYRAKLDTAGDVRREMARCYREARSKVMPVGDLGKYVYALRSISEVIAAAELEARIEDLESQR